MGKELKGDAKKVEQQAETAGKELKAKVQIVSSGSNVELLIPKCTACQ